MGNSPSIPGLGGGRPHIRRDHGYVDSDRGWRPEQTQTRDTDIEEEEEVERGVDSESPRDLCRPQFYSVDTKGRRVYLVIWVNG